MKKLLTILFILLVTGMYAQKTEDSWFGPDKTKHCVYSAWGTYALCIGYDELHVKKPYLYAAGTMILIGAGKEIVYDGMMKKGQKSWKDFTWDVVGSSFACVSIVIPLEVRKHKKYK